TTTARWGTPWLRLPGSGSENSQQPDEIVEGIVGHPAGEQSGLTSPAFREPFGCLLLGRCLAPAETIEGRILLGPAMSLGGLLEQFGRTDALEMEATQLRGAQCPFRRRP